MTVRHGRGGPKVWSDDRETEVSQARTARVIDENAWLECESVSLGGLHWTNIPPSGHRGLHRRSEGSQGQRRRQITNEVVSMLPNIERRGPTSLRRSTDGCVLIYSGKSPPGIQAATN